MSELGSYIKPINIKPQRTAQPGLFFPSCQGRAAPQPAPLALILEGPLRAALVSGLAGQSVAPSLFLTFTQPLRPRPGVRGLRRQWPAEGQSGGGLAAAAASWQRDSGQMGRHNMLGPHMASGFYLGDLELELA